MLNFEFIVDTSYFKDLAFVHTMTSSNQSHFARVVRTIRGVSTWLGEIMTKLRSCAKLAHVYPCHLCELSAKLGQARDTKASVSI